MARVLLLGESEGSARYLFGALAEAGHPVRHWPARDRLDAVDEPFDVVILSDFPAAQLGAAAAEAIRATVEAGGGLVMIGGWTSFTGRGGDWGASPLASLLPVVCAVDDDRRNVPGGVWLEVAEPGHPILSDLDLDAPPVVCGYNEVTLATGATLALRGRHIIFRAGEPARGVAVPLLATGPAGRGRAVAYMSDLTPHWCGGLVDWGAPRLRLATGAEVGATYVTFVSNLVGWAAGAG